MSDKLIREKDLVEQMTKLFVGPGQDLIIRAIQSMPAASAPITISMSDAEAKAFRNFRHVVKLAAQLETSVEWHREYLGELQAVVGIVERAIGEAQR